MSLRGSKRASGARGDEPSTSKRRRTEPEDPLWALRPVSDLKMSSIYNRSASEAPAELFRKDLISAMKLPDSEPLTTSEYWVVTDTWKQDWERGVQVPVNPDSLPAPKVKIIENPLPENFAEFKLPKDKYIHLCRDPHYQSEKHQLSGTPAKADACCSYDLDATDLAWLKLLNAERARAGAAPVTEDQLERVIEELEVRTWDKIQAIMKSEEGLGIEYDENVICDVCRSPDSEDGNEMVFCDSCNICVHQACYGITVIPDGQWLCRPCGDGVRPKCVLCPNQGGAMKCTPSGHKWAHVSCVLWIPEVSIGCAEKMEPITKISSIPTSRWSLVCVLCRERKGACIQCSVKTCKTAYHVTCAFKHGLEMRAIIEDENADDGVKLRSYCQKHSVNSKKDKSSGSGSEEEEVKRKRRKDMTSEEKTQARAARLQEIEREFDKHVSVKDISTHLLDVDQDAINYMYNYWKLKRRAMRNRPLLPPKSDDSELLTHRQEQADLDKMKMFVQLRQDLERVRNLCYMVSRREKLSRSFFRMREQTFHKQVAVLSAEKNLAGPDLKAIIEANHGPSIYDRLYSHPDAPDHKNDFDAMLARIAPPDSSDEKKKDRNGMIKGSKGSGNPYKKHYVNGSRRSGSIYSGMSSEESAPEISRSTRYRGRAIGSSTDEDTAKKASTSPRKKVSPKTKGKKSPKKVDRKRKKTPQSKAVVESSSEDESINAAIKKDATRSRTLRQMEKEMAAGKDQSTDSDELITMRSTKNKFPVDIYSDSSDDESGKEKNTKTKRDKAKSEKIKAEKSPGGNDSQQSLPRTKAAMKEFIPSRPEKKSSCAEEKPAPKKRGRKPSNKDKKVPESDDEAKKENIKSAKQKEHPTDLIVPQRQAAKKASENMRSTTIAKKEEPVAEKQAVIEDKVRPKLKSKGKEVKEKESPSKVGRKKSKEGDKEQIAYVPQRQAAKKAAAHIKSGLGTKLPAVETDTEKKKEDSRFDLKLSPKREDPKSTKTPSNEESSSSSSNSCSSSCSSSSSSETEHERPEMKPTAKAREIKPLGRQPSLFSPPGPKALDLPFLDRVSRPLSSTSASSDSDSSQASRYSGSSSPIPKRPRRRRKGKSLSGETSPRKAPDKKLKTSERGSECGVASSSAEGEEPSRAGPARAATRVRTRSTTASGNMSHKPDAGQRKSSRDDDTTHTSTYNEPPKEGREPCELPITERKENETIKIEVNEIKPVDLPKVEKEKTVKNNRRSISIDDKDKIKPVIESHTSPIKSSPIKSSPIKSSPKKSADPKQKSIMSRRQSVKEPPPKEKTPRPNELVEPIQQRTMSCLETKVTPERIHTSPANKPVLVEKSLDFVDDKSPRMLHDDYVDNDKWVPKAPSPTVHPPAVEKRGDHQKYMTEDKAFDSDSADKTSIKMIAKIQANLNENTMIKSPKTPMDARSINMEIMDVDSAMPRNMRKRSIMDSEKKYITQDASHVQGVEISKSAKIPSAVNPYPNRIFSPQTKENELFEFDLLNVDDGFNQEIIQPFTSYPDITFFKEDSKEQGVKETMNLVDRLRMQLSSKKPPMDAVPSQEEQFVNEDKDGRPDDNNISSDSVTGEQERDQHVPLSVSPKKKMNVDLDHRTPSQDMRTVVNHKPHPLAINDTQTLEPSYGSKDEPIAMTSHEKWSDVSTSQYNVQHRNDHKYDHNIPYRDEVKESATGQSDVQSTSEIGDSISLSKQSDDSQSVSVVDQSIHSNDPELTQDNHNYDNNNSVIHSDCATISSPYASQDSKWRESKITTRRSSASSTNSEESVCSRKTEMKMHVGRCGSQASGVVDMEAYQPMPYACGIETGLPQYPPYATDPSTYVPLFGAHASLPPGPLFHPPLSTLMPPMPKPNFPTLCATFTTSSQNLALTTAMIAPPTPKPIDSPRDDDSVLPPVSIADKFSSHTVPSPSPSPSISVGASVDSFTESSSLPSISKAIELDPPSSSTLSMAHEVKSSPKVKTPKFGKSPGKSPAGISPKQGDGKGSKRQSNRSNRSVRGRGRSKSRAAGVHGYPPVDYLGDSIQSKLVGTPYDFDKEIAEDGVDLKSLRERRKSVEVREDRKSDASYKEQSRSPGAGSDAGKAGSPEAFSAVAPVLPGPVDMRNYQGFTSGAPAAPAAAPYHHSHLLDFAAGTADQQLADIDEEVEKQLHSALMASNPGPASPPRAPSPPPMPKVSLSDSRNQLKVKIKGPFLDANYVASSLAPPPPPVVDPAATPCAASIGGSTNLRRMRKKELLYQYNQDKNNDPSIVATPPPAQPPPLVRTVITIPKAVASMTSIPTREDYKIADPSADKRRRKSGVSRELRQLAGGEDEAAGRRRGRAKPPPAAAPAAASALHTTPKLKIKFGQNTVQAVPDESPSLQFRPPKKRLLSMPIPSLEDIRRENMKYRRQVMADFQETEKKKKKPGKGEKCKKKKNKKSNKDKLPAVKSESDSATKLIITLKLPREKEKPLAVAGPSAAAAAAPEPAVDAFEFDPLAPDPLALDPPACSGAAPALRNVRTDKVTPIRLKLSRSAQGYVAADSERHPAPAPAPAPPHPVR